MAVRAAPAVPERRSRRERRARRTTLFRRLFLTYVAVVGLAVAVLVLAPITVSVPTALAELAVILGGFAVTLVLFHAFLRRALAPLETLTEVMHQVDPLAPGQRIDATTGDEEVVALAEAFNEMLDRLEGERRDSGRRALAAQEAERRRIARELHDEIGQLLTGLILRGETLARRAPEEVREDVVGLREGAREAAEEVRLIARRLRPEALDELGLQSALLALCTTVAEQAGLEVERRFARDLPLTAEEELVIYRVAQESLTNVVRHAQARRVMVTLEPDRDRGVVLTVRDDGVGLPARGRGRLERHPWHARAGAARRRAAERERRRAAWHRGGLATAGQGRPMTTPLVTRVLLADDHPVVRNGLRELLNSEPDFRVVAEVDDGAQAVERALADDVDLVILDVTMPRMTGLQAARELAARKPGLRILMLSMHENEQFLFEALRAGASGYVLKTAADRDLVNACRATMRGETFLYAGAVAALVREHLDRDATSLDPLTPRELEVVKLVAEGHTSDEIAGMLFISRKTVDRHRANILEKLGMRDRVDLTRYAIRRGLITP